MRAQRSFFIRLMPAFAVLVTGLLIDWAAHAGGTIIGDGAIAVREKDFPYLCRITIQKGDEEGHCSGTLVSPTEIATGAHCFGRDYGSGAWGVSAVCGGRGARIEKVQLPADHFWVDEIKPYPSVDYARVTLRREMPNAPMPKAKGPDAYFANDGTLLPKVTCWMGGFGHSAQSDFGSLHVANLSRHSLVYASGVITMRHPREAFVTLSADHGDSGGALYCQAPGRTPELVGVIVSYIPQSRDRDQNRIANLFAPIWSQTL